MTVINTFPLSPNNATDKKDGTMSSYDKIKLDGIEKYANNYVHPESHSADIIIENTNRKFITQQEKDRLKTLENEATVTEKGLMSKEDKKKLDGISENANNYIHPINHPATMIIQDTTHRFATDEEKEKWNNKASTDIATTTSNGLMSSNDKVKLDGIESGANNYVHPESHDASIIIQDTTHRFVTDEEKEKWNNKADTTTATIEAKGLMSIEDKIKLNDIEEGANNYIHPDYHHASMIIQDANLRFVTNDQIHNWSSKPNNKLEMGLGNVTNDAQVKRVEMGIPNGVATLDNYGKIPAVQLPSFVDDILEFDTISSFPEEGESSKIYVDKETNNTYRWSGTSYVVVGNSLTLGETESTAYSGIKGKQLSESLEKIKDGTTIVPKALDAKTVSGFTVGVNVPVDAKFTDTIYTHPETHDASIIIENTDHRFVSDEQIRTWDAKADTTLVTKTTNGIMSHVDKIKLDNIESGANNYIHPETHDASIITQDNNHRFVTDVQISSWDNKSDSDHTHDIIKVKDTKALNPTPNDSGFIKNAVTFDLKSNSEIDSPSVNGTYSTVMNIAPGEDKSKGNGYQLLFGYGNSTTVPKMMIRTNTLNSTTWGNWTELYTTANRPTPEDIGAASSSHTHLALNIVEDSVHRFVSDEQINTWDAKASKSVSTQISNGLMSSTDKKKLDGIETGANNYTHPENHDASIITEDTTHRFVSDEQIRTWNAKASTDIATTTSNGLMSHSDKQKLDNIAHNANNYIHPETHDASMIIEDTTHRFVTDDQVNIWNNKADTTLATIDNNGLMSLQDKININTLLEKVKSLETKCTELEEKLKRAVFVE